MRTQLLRGRAVRPWLLGFLLLLLGVARSSGAQAQHLFPTRFSNCQTDAFSLERDTITARTDHAALARLVEQAVDEKVKGTVKGRLILQILVDQAGNSCLLSLQNDTNVKASKLHLPAALNGQLKWQPLQEKVAAIVVIDFTSQGLVVSRHGFDFNKGRHELKDGRG